MVLPATPGWVSLPLVVGGPRHSWLGSAGGGGVWFVVCGVWCVVCGGGVLVGLWLVCGVVGPSRLLAEVPVCYSPPLLAGFRCRWWWAVPATPGWGPLAAVVCGVWCVVCGGGVLVGLWLVCGVVGPSPLLAEVPVCYSPPLLAAFRCRWWLAVPATPGWGPLAAVVCGVWCVVCGVCRWCVGGVVACVWCGWSLATPGEGSCVLLPATPGLVSLPVVVGGTRHSWLGSAGGGVVWCVVCGVWCVAMVCWWGCGWCVVWLVPRHSWRRFLCATPRHSWLGFAAGGGGRSPPLLAGVRWRRWCVVCGVWCVVCGGGVLLGLWLMCGVVGPSPLLAEVPVCYSPPLLAGFRCWWWWAVPATPGWGPLAAVVCGVSCVVCGGGVLVKLWLVCGVVGPSPCVFVPWCPSPWSWCVCFCVLRFLSLPLGALCRVLCCAVCLGLRCRDALLRVVSPGVVLLCAVLFCCARLVPLLVVLCPLVLPVALGPCALRRSVLRCSSALCVFCRCVLVCAVVRRSALCCVCPWVLCCAFPVLSALCGAVLRCAGVLALCCSCGACCCWRPVLWCAAVCCAVSFGVLWCGAGSGGPWLSAGAVLWRPAVRFALLVVLVCVFSLCVRCCVALRVVLFGSGCVCAVVGASCCGVFLGVVVYPWAFCGVVVPLWCVVVYCCAVRCPVVSCALCCVVRCCAALRCCAGGLCCAVVCAAGVCFSFCPLSFC